ncbi:MAG: glycosyltransferase family 4 protein [Bacteroidales bacterium]|nr:glycosyltransferase family 4 protein [Bacteroidales bacterium]
MKTVLIGIPCLMVGGTEMQTLRLAQALNEGGFQVVVCCYFEYKFEMVQAFQQLGCKVVCLSAYGRRPDHARALRRFLKRGLARTVAEYQPDVAHVQYMSPGALPLWYLRRLGVKTLFATLHTTADIYPSLRLIRFLQKHWVKAFTCVSLTAEKSFFGSCRLYSADIKLARHNHFTLYNCLPPKMPIRSRAVAQSLTIGSIIRFEEIKGADLLLPAFALVLKEIPDAHLLLVGDGKLREKMELQQQQLSIPPRHISWLGTLPHEKLPEQYARMDMAWMPSRSEGFGLSALEAMSQGVPIVASHIGGLSEIIRDAKDGMLFPVGDLDALAHITLSLWNDKALMQSLADAGQKRAADFSYDSYKELVLNLYSK